LKYFYLSKNNGDDNMGKKIVVLNGSPRPKGNTSTLIKSFTEGAEESDNSVKVFNLDSMNISGCKGCFCGNDNPDSPCVQKDDMDKIYPHVKDADIIVLASPLYYWNMSGQLRTAFDRLFALEEANAGFRSEDRGAILLMAAEGNGFDICVQYYKSLLEHLKWKDLGMVLAGGVYNIGDIEGSDKLVEAKELGASIK
jgi:multimeric flavodoxin WrbA